MLEIKNIIIEKKKGLNGLINRLDTAKERKERISEPEVTSLEILQTEMQREKKEFLKKECPGTVSWTMQKNRINL